MIDQLAIFAAEVKKVAREVGMEGKLGQSGCTSGSRQCPGYLARNHIS